MLISTIVVALTSSLGACAQRAEPPLEAPPALVALVDLTAKPAEFASRPIRVRGRLDNTGKNYQVRADRRIVLSDGKDHSIEVRPWLPLTGPAPSAQTETRPTLAEFLGKEVELVGSLTRREEPDRQGEYIFHVTSAKVLAGP